MFVDICASRNRIDLTSPTQNIHLQGDLSFYVRFCGNAGIALRKFSHQTTCVLKVTYLSSEAEIVIPKIENQLTAFIL